MKARHAMPFGASLDGDVARFALWAPSASRVELLLDAPAPDMQRTTHPMRAEAGGWHRAERPGCGAGQRYRYRVFSPKSGVAGMVVPDPAARANPGGIDAGSALVDPTAFDWDDGWHGRPWHEAVVYELHVGTFTPEGTYRSAAARLPHLVALGVTAVELMPLAQFEGRRGWGYDGVLPFAPHPDYGTPDELKGFVQAAHRVGLMVLLDVVYNHFGPAGNYLPVYAEAFFNPRHATPWGDAIGFDGDGAAMVRDFYVHNALYWLEEFRFDGLRFDAVHAIRDDSVMHILDELPKRLRDALPAGRRVHLVLENEANEAHRLYGGISGSEPRFESQWNDDFHHAAHVLLAGEAGGYYADYVDDAGSAVAALGRSLAEGFVYQGEPSPHRHGEPRGEPSRGLPPTAFIDFLQNHDQIGNRPYGERLVRLSRRAPLEAVTVLWLLAPSVPMLFMGEEFGATTPFRYFCDFGGELGRAVSQGRKRELAGMLGLADPDAADPPIPDPNDAASFSESRLDWAAVDTPDARRWLDLYTGLLALRRDVLVPRLPHVVAGAGRHVVFRSGALQVAWPLDDGSAWVVQANLSDADATLPAVVGDVVRWHGDGPAGAAADPAAWAHRLAPWSVRWLLVSDAARLAWRLDGATP